jgi:hypothetical protein
LLPVKGVSAEAVLQMLEYVIRIVHILIFPFRGNLVSTLHPRL